MPDERSRSTVRLSTMRVYIAVDAPGMWWRTQLQTPYPSTFCSYFSRSGTLAIHSRSREVLAPSSIAFAQWMQSRGLPSVRRTQLIPTIHTPMTIYYYFSYIYSYIYVLNIRETRRPILLTGSRASLEIRKASALTEIWIVNYKDCLLIDQRQNEPHIPSHIPMGVCSQQRSQLECQSALYPGTGSAWRSETLCPPR